MVFYLRLHQFEVTTMLPVHTTAVKRRLIKLLSSVWLLVHGSKFQLNDVTAFTATEEDNVIHQITDLREYAEKDYKTGSEAFKLGLSIRRVQKHGNKGFKNSGSVLAMTSN